MHASWKSIGSGKAALTFVSAWAVGAFGQVRPNIVVYLSDDHSQCDAAICGAAPALRTPSMDLLAKDGVVFDNAFAATPACGPTDGPSRKAPCRASSPSRRAGAATTRGNIKNGRWKPACGFPFWIGETTWVRGFLFERQI